MPDLPEPSETLPQGPNGAGPRTMADITRLFMNGANPTPPSMNRPQRIPPKSAAVAPRPTLVEPPQSPPAAVAPAPVSSPPPVTVASIPTLQLALAATASSLPAFIDAARHLATEHNTTLGLIVLDGPDLQIHRVTAIASPLPAIPANRHAAIDVRIARTLFALRAGIDHWLILLPPTSTANNAGDALLAALSDWLIISDTDNDAVLACYRTLKSCCARSPDQRRTARLLLRTPDAALASRIHARLNQVTEGFLQQPLELLRPVGSSSATAQVIASFPLAQPAETEAAFFAVADFVQELAGQADDEMHEIDPPLTQDSRVPADDPDPATVLDLEERTALAAAFESTASPATNGHGYGATFASQVRPAPVAAVPPAPAPATNRAALSVIPIESAALTRDALADALRAALAALPHITLLEARPPAAADAALAVDSAGRLHLWTLADAPDPTSWATLWQWASEHRQLIALTCREIPLDPAAPVHIHLVLPPDAPATLPRQLPAGMHLHRLLEVRWGDRSGLVLTSAN